MLTIDRYLQRVAERELQRAVAENKGIGGQLLIMDPSTGGLLAAASWPTYSLTESIRPDQQALMKPTIATNVYEPGSVMKIVTLAAALDEGVVTPETTTQDGGSVIIDGVRISNWDHNGHGTMTMRQMLIYSSNVGSSFVSGRLGPERFYKYIDLFGFGQLTGIRLPGEAEGSYRTPEDPSWRRIDLATNSFGQGIAVTPLQMLTAVASIANDGILMRPMLVKEMRRGDEVVPNSPGAVRRTVSSATAEQMTDIMISVMEQPGLKAQNVPGYVIAGKSGTADFPTTVGYLKDRTYASFIGFGPTQNPRWAMLVRIDAPEAMYGGAVAAPVFKRMAEELMTYLRIPPTEPRPTPRATTGTR